MAFSGGGIGSSVPKSPFVNGIPTDPFGNNPFGTAGPGDLGYNPWSNIGFDIGGIPSTFGLPPGIGGNSGPLGSIGGSSGGIGSGNMGGLAIGPLLSALGSLVPAGLDIFGGLNAMGQQNWQNNAKVGVLNALNQLLGNSTGVINQYGTAIEPTMLANMVGQLSLGGVNQQNAFNTLGQVGNQLAGGAFTNPTSTNAIPGLQGVFDTTGGLIGGDLGAASIFGNNLQNIQNNPMLQQLFGQASNIAGGGGGQGLLSSIANEMLGNRGMSNIAGLVQQAASGPLTTGGYTGPLNYATQYGEALTQPNPFVGQVQNVAANILGKNPLLPMNEVLGLAQNQAATDVNNRFNATRRQLANETGVTGPAIAGGGQNELLSQFGDQALQEQSQALTNALMGQQGLQLGLFGQGGNLFNSGVQGALGFSGQGLNSLLQAASQATGNLGTAGNLGLGSGNQVNQNLLTGAGLQGQANNTTLQALQSILGGLGTQNQLYGTNAGALANLLGQAGSLTQQQAGNLFGLQQFGQGQQQNIFNTLLNLAGQQGGLGNAQQSQGFQSAQFPQNVLDQWTSLLGNVYQNMTSLFGNPSNPVNYMSPAASVLSQGNPLGGALGSVFGPRNPTLGPGQTLGSDVP